MKASAFPRICRGWNPDTNEMLSPERLVTLGLTVSPDGLPAYRDRPFPVILMWYSGQLDTTGKQLFEGDICKVHILNEFGSIIIDYGVMRWNPIISQFHLAVPSSMQGQELNVQKVELLGNEFENLELVPLVKNQAGEESLNG